MLKRCFDLGAVVVTGKSAARIYNKPWANIASRTAEQLSDDTGLAPSWVCEGGNIERFVFEVPTSEPNHWLHWMNG